MSSCISLNDSLTLYPSKYQTVNVSRRHEEHLSTLLEPHKACTIGDSVLKTVSKVIYLCIGFYFGLSWSSYVLLISKKVFCPAYYVKSLYAFSVTRNLLLRFVNLFMLPIIFYCFRLFFLSILRKAFAVLRRVIKEVSRGVLLSNQILTNTMM